METLPPQMIASHTLANKTVFSMGHFCQVCKEFFAFFCSKKIFFQSAGGELLVIVPFKHYLKQASFCRS
jgi:hypothetical protein